MGVKEFITQEETNKLETLKLQIENEINQAIQESIKLLDWTYFKTSSDSKLNNITANTHKK